MNCYYGWSKKDVFSVRDFTMTWKALKGRKLNRELINGGYCVFVNEDCFIIPIGSVYGTFANVGPKHHPFS